MASRPLADHRGVQAPTDGRTPCRGSIGRPPPVEGAPANRRRLTPWLDLSTWPRCSTSSGRTSHSRPPPLPLLTALAGVNDTDAEHIGAVQAASRPGSRRLDEHAVLSTVMRHEEGFYASTDTRGVSECKRESERSCSLTPGARRDDEAPSDPKA